MEDSGEIKFWDWIKNFFSSKDNSSLQELLSEARENGILKNDEYQMLLNVLKLAEIQVDEIMVPRTDMVCADVESDIDDVVKLIIEKGHSRIPVFKDNKDQIIGIIHAKDLLKCYYLDDEDKKLQSIMRKPYFVPETKKVRELLLELKSKKIHMAIVLDEYGGTSGLVTMEDILEEIVGEIEDEYDRPRPKEIVTLEDGGYLLSGRVYLEEIEEELGIKLVSEQVDTLSGYLCEKLGRVPQKGEEVVEENFKMIIEEADLKHVHWVKLYFLPEK
ncbi:MAG: hemolysin (HlyC) family protein [Desulfonauticus sp.]|nr:hemolysin (HlyC) family protein [Desulfonauticus sp.]